MTATSRTSAAPTTPTARAGTPSVPGDLADHAIIVVEPMVGAWSDRVRAASGTRSIFLLAGAFVSAATFVLLFDTPKLPNTLETFAVVSAAAESEMIRAL